MMNKDDFSWYGLNIIFSLELMYTRLFSGPCDAQQKIVNASINQQRQIRLQSASTSVTHHHIFPKMRAGASNWKKWWRDGGFAGNGSWQAWSFSPGMWKSLMCWQSVLARRVAITKWWQLEHFEGCQPLERHGLKRLLPATYLKMLWHSN